jgi:HAD superfamily hydrolase (TIGR01509 family)
VNGVVFDLDGVIVDSHPLHRIAWREFLRTVGKHVDEKSLDFVLDGRTRKEILLHFLGPLNDEQLNHYGHIKDELLRTLGDQMQTIPGVVEFLDNLSQANMRMALATSSGRQRACGTLNEMGIAYHFRAIVTADDVTLGKPDPAIYRLAAERLQLAPENLVAFEDAVSGVKAARGAGIRCIGIACGSLANDLRSAGADFVISDFHSLSVQQLEKGFQPHHTLTVTATGGATSESLPLRLTVQ